MQSVPRTRSSFKVKEVEKTKIHKMSDGSTAWAQNTQLMGLDKMFLVCFFCSHIMTHEQQHNKRMTFLNGKLKETKVCGPPKKVVLCGSEKSAPPNQRWDWERERSGNDWLPHQQPRQQRTSQKMAFPSKLPCHTSPPGADTPNECDFKRAHRNTLDSFFREIIQTTPLTTPLQDGGDSQHRRAQGGGRAS